MTINVPTSDGELLDKITILELKMEYIQDEGKLSNVEKEYFTLNSLMNSLHLSTEIQNLRKQLKDINRTLWNIEDKIRVKEKNKQFDEEFIELARSVYITNDERARVKREINVALESDLIEEKQYDDYK